MAEYKAKYATNAIKLADKDNFEIQAKQKMCWFLPNEIEELEAANKKLIKDFDDEKAKYMKILDNTELFAGEK